MQAAENLQVFTGEWVESGAVNGSVKGLNDEMATDHRAAVANNLLAENVRM